MNSVSLVGRLTKDPELIATASGVNKCSFSIAVNRNFKNSQGEYEADFISCVAWKGQAEFVSKYFGKGNLIGVLGRLQTRIWDGADGNKQFRTEVIVSEVTFIEKKKDGKPNQTTTIESEELIEVYDEDLPF